jgi:hypothetical protein
LRERGFELKKGWFKVYSSELSGQPSWGRVGPFMAPRRNLPVGVSRTRTCLVLRVGHVQNPSLEPGLSTGHVQCLALTWVRAEEPDMSGNYYCNPIREPDKSGYGLSRCEGRLGQTCTVQEPDMSSKCY